MLRAINTIIAMLLCQLALAQAITTQPNQQHKLSQAQVQRLRQLRPSTQHASQRSNQHLQIDYASTDDSIGTLAGDNISTYEWAINKNFPNDSSHNYSLKWAYVALDSIVDYPSMQSNLFPTTNYQLDSIYIPIRHVNNSGQYDTIIISEYARVNHSLPSVNSSGLLDNYFMHSDTFRVNTSISASSYQYLVVRPNLTIPGYQHAGIGISFFGSNTDSLFVLNDYRDKCNGGCAAYPSFFNNSYYNLVLFDQNNTNLGGVQGNSASLYYDCNANTQFDTSGCEAIYLQNFEMISFLTADVGPPNLAPVADFKTFSSWPVAGIGVNFIDLSTNIPTSWSWTFQGGTPSTEQASNPTRVIFANAGSYLVQFIATNLVGSDTISKVINVVSNNNACDTFKNFTVSDPQLLAPFAGGGYIFGNNQNGDLAKAEYFSNNYPSVPINGLALKFGVATYANASDSVTIALWDNSGVNGSPGNLIGSKNIAISNIANDIQNGAFTEVAFSNSPAPIGNYYVGVVLSQLSGDTVALYSTPSVDPTRVATTWGKQSNGNWYRSDDPMSWGIHASLFVRTEYCGQTHCPEFIVNQPFIVDDSCNSGFGAIAANVGVSTNLPVNYLWSNGETSSIIYGQQAGIYGLTVTDSSGCSIDTAFTILNICSTAQPLVADFSFTPTSPTAGSGVNFTDLSTNSPTSWAWSFPGATPSSSTAQNPSNVVFPAAGSYPVTLIATNSINSDTITKTVVVSSSSNYCNWVSNITPQDSITIYANSAGGYISGNNAYGDLAKAEFFSNPAPGIAVSSAQLYFGIATYANPSDTLMVAVWDANGAGGSPGTMLAHENVTLGAIDSNFQSNNFTVVNFSNNPVPSGNYYVGVLLNNSPGDTVALITSYTQPSRTNTAWERQSNGNWYALSDTTNSWGINVSYAIYVDECGTNPCTGFAATPTVANDSCNSGTGAIYLAIGGGTAPYGFAWSGGQTTANITGLSVGNYSVTVVDGNGCSLDTTLSVGMDCPDVWPGDADASGLVDANDVLQISVEYGSTGPTRQNASTQWAAQACTDWNGVTFGINDKHADCDGNGLIDVNDTAVVSLNYGLTHQKGAQQNRAQQTDPTLSLVAEQTSVQAGGTAKFKIMLGDAGNTVNNLYGVAFSINYDPTIFNANNVSINTDSSWIGTAGSNLFTFRKVVAANGRLDVVLARTNHQNATGFGQIGELELGVNGNLTNPSSVTLTPTIIKGITANLTPLTFNTQAAAVNIDTTTGIIPIMLANAVSVYPNPSNGHFVLNIQAVLGNATWQLMDITGRQLQAGALPAQPNLSKEMDLSSYPKGIYLLKLTSDEGSTVKRLVLE